MPPNSLIHLVCALCCVLMTTAPAAAQFVQGRALHGDTDEPLEAVSVELRAAAGGRVAHAITDSAGRFVMQSPRVGEHEIVASRIGLQPVSGRLNLIAGERIEVVLRMSEAAVLLEPISVEARIDTHIGPLAGYYERVRRRQLSGMGRFITRDQIELRQPSVVTDLLRSVPRVRVNWQDGRASDITFSSRGGCTPKVYVDGVLTNRLGPATINDLVHPLDLEGVEVYEGLAQMPGEFHDVDGCGVVLLWTRRISDGGRPFSLRRLAIAVGLFGLLVLVSR